MLASVVVAALLAFAATNVDDLVLLLLLCDRGERFRTVVLGQYVGFAVIVAVSVVASAGATFLRPEWVGFLGLAPFALGVKALVSLRHQSEAPRLAEKTWGLLSIATITVANGGDNIAVYAPLLAGRSAAHVATVIIVFAAMIPLWCWLALRLVRLAVIAAALARWGHWIAPAVLVGLGIYIFVDAGTATYVLARLHGP